MDHGESKLCDSCYARHKTNVAVIWCPNCGQGFCFSCGECHNTSKVAQFHETISIDDYQKLPSVVTDIKTNCDEHGEIYELYCPNHRQCLCLSCFKGSHQGCNDVALLRDVIRNMKSSAAVEDVEISMKDIDEIFSKLRENRLENKRRLEEQKTECVANIQQLRLSINNHLDQLENEMVYKITLEVENIQKSIDYILKNIEERSKNVRKIQDDILLVKQMSTELQVFLGLNTFHDIIKIETDYLAKLERENQVNEYYISETFLSFCDEITSLGNASVLQIGSTLKIKVGKKERAQNMLPKEITLADVSVEFKKTIQYPFRESGISVSGCTVLDDGNVLYADQGNKLVVISNESGDFRDVVSFSSVWDVAYIDNYKAVVTVPDKNEIVFLDLVLGRSLKRITFNTKCRGIDYVNSKIVLRGTGVFYLTDKEGSVSSVIKANSLSHVAIFEDKIFGTNSENNSVYCYGIDGTIIWKFTDEKMEGPRGITTEQRGYTYIACCKSNNVIVISEDGNDCKEILNKSDGLDSPVAIHFEKNLKKLLVCNRVYGALLCNVINS